MHALSCTDAPAADALAAAACALTPPPPCLRSPAAMHERAEMGEAAHAAYKGGLDAQQTLQLKELTESVLRRAAAAAAAASSAAAAGGSASSGDAAAEALFRHLDQNGDGRIRWEEDRRRGASSDRRSASSQRLAGPARCACTLVGACSTPLRIRLGASINTRVPVLPAAWRSSSLLWRSWVCGRPRRSRAPPPSCCSWPPPRTAAATATAPSALRRSWRCSARHVCGGAAASPSWRGCRACVTCLAVGSLPASKVPCCAAPVCVFRHRLVPSGSCLTGTHAHPNVVNLLLPLRAGGPAAGPFCSGP